MSDASLAVLVMLHTSITPCNTLVQTDFYSKQSHSCGSSECIQSLTLLKPVVAKARCLQLSSCSGETEDIYFSSTNEDYSRFEWAGQTRQSLLLERSLHLHPVPELADPRTRERAHMLVVQRAPKLAHFGWLVSEEQQLD
jgi:hypothetical protein